MKLGIFSLLAVGGLIALLHRYFDIEIEFEKQIEDDPSRLIVIDCPMCSKPAEVIYTLYQYNHMTEEATRAFIINCVSGDHPPVLAA